MREPSQTVPSGWGIADDCRPVGREWQGGLRERVDSDGIVGIHLAIFVEPYLSYVLDGSKTFESRFSKNRCPPYGRVKPGDFLLLKRSGGRIVGICRVAHVWFFELDAAKWQEIRTRFAKGLCAQDEGFWKAREGAAFASIMKIIDVRPLEPFSCEKQDRRGWVVLNEQRQPTLL